MLFQTVHKGCHDGDQEVLAEAFPDRRRAFVSDHRWIDTSRIKTDREAWKILNWLLTQMEARPEKKGADKVK